MPRRKESSAGGRDRRSSSGGKTGKTGKSGETLSGRSRVEELREELVNRDKLLKRLFEIESAVLNTSRDGILFINRRGKVIETNPAFSEITGIPREELINKSSVRLVHRYVDPTYLPAVLGAIRNNPSRPEGIPNFEVEHAGKAIEVRTPKVPADSKILIVFLRDVTERRRLENELRDSRFRFQTISELASDYIFRLVIERGIPRLDYLSDNYKALTGRDPGEAVRPDSWSEFLGPEAMTRVGRELPRLVREGGTVDFEILSHKKDGSPRWINVFARAIRSADGRSVESIIGAVRDVTARKSAEEALRESEARFKSAFDDGPTGMCLVSMEGKFSDVNPAFCSMLGYSAEELRTKGFRDITHPDDLASSVEWVADLTAGRPVSPELEKRYLAKDGRVIWGLVRSRVIRSPDAKPLFFITHIQDITERKRMIGVLRVSEEKFSLAFNASPALMTISEIDTGLMVDVNEMFLKTLGYPREEVVGRTTWEIDLFADTDRRTEALRLLRRDGRFRDLEIPVRTRTGEVRYGIFSGELIRLAEKEYLLSVMVDITERRSIEERLMRSEKLSAVGQLAAGVAHEFNNILAVISGHLDLMKLSQAPAPKATIETLETQIGRAQGIIGQLTAFARPSGTTMQAADLGGLVTEVFAILRKQFELDNIDVRLNFVDPPVSAEVNTGQIHQVLLNLFINARHAMKPHGRGVLRIDLRRIGEMVRLRVSDDGVGMDEKTRRNAFLPFFTTKGAFARDEYGLKGTGLGLSVSHSIIERHQGAISFVSEPEQGTTFTILLPSRQSHPSAVRQQEFALAPELLERFMKSRVLVVDDETLVLEVVAGMLRNSGCACVETAASGNEALARLGREEFDLVLLDMFLPGIDGREILKRIRETGSRIKVVLITGNLDIFEVDALAAGADGLVRKPFDLRDLVLAFDRATQHLSPDRSSGP